MNVYFPFIRTFHNLWIFSQVKLRGVPPRFFHTEKMSKTQPLKAKFWLMEKKVKGTVNGEEWE